MVVIESVKNLPYEIPTPAPTLAHVETHDRAPTPPPTTLRAHGRPDNRSSPLPWTSTSTPEPLARLVSAQKMPAPTFAHEPRATRAMKNEGNDVTLTPPERDGAFISRFIIKNTVETGWEERAGATTTHLNVVKPIETAVEERAGVTTSDLNIKKPVETYPEDGDGTPPSLIKTVDVPAQGGDGRVSSIVIEAAPATPIGASKLAPTSPSALSAASHTEPPTPTAQQSEEPTTATGIISNIAPAPPAEEPLETLAKDDDAKAFQDGNGDASPAHIQAADAKAIHIPGAGVSPVGIVSAEQPLATHGDTGVAATPTTTVRAEEPATQDKAISFPPPVISPTPATMLPAEVKGRIVTSVVTAPREPAPTATGAEDGDGNPVRREPELVATAAVEGSGATSITNTGETPAEARDGVTTPIITTPHGEPGATPATVVETAAPPSAPEAAGAVGAPVSGPAVASGATDWSILGWWRWATGSSREAATTEKAAPPELEVEASPPITTPVLPQQPAVVPKELPTPNTQDEEGVTQGKEPPAEVPGPKATGASEGGSGSTLGFLWRWAGYDQDPVKEPAAPGESGAKAPPQLDVQILTKEPALVPEEAPAVVVVDITALAPMIEDADPVDGPESADPVGAPDRSEGRGASLMGLLRQFVIKPSEEAAVDSTMEYDVEAACFVAAHSSTEPVTGAGGVKQGLWESIVGGARRVVSKVTAFLAYFVESVRAWL
jgi:hypothetical protein